MLGYCNTDASGARRFGGSKRGLLASKAQSVAQCDGTTQAQDGAELSVMFHHETL